VSEGIFDDEFRGNEEGNVGSEVFGDCCTRL